MKLAPDGLSYYCRKCRYTESKRWRVKNPGYMKKKMDVWNETNREYKSQKCKAWRKENPGYKKKWRKDNYEHYIKQARKHNRTRRQRKLNINETYNEQDEQFTMNLFSNRCICCNSTDRLHIDHHYPLSKGFALSRDNAVVLCITCNTSKNNKMPEDFYTPSKLKGIEYLLALAIADGLIL